MRDYGAWRAPREGDRGRGLSLMQALMDTVEVTPTPEGTTVRLRRTLLTPTRTEASMMDLVQLEIEQRGDVVIARVTGELDLAGAPSTGDAIGEAVPDVGARRWWSTSPRSSSSTRAASRCSSTWPAGSAAAARSCASWRATGEPVARVLELVEFERAAPVHETLDEALAQVSADGA